MKARIQKYVLRSATFESLESTIIFIAEWEHTIVHTAEYLKSYSTKFVENSVQLLKECSFLNQIAILVWGHGKFENIQHHGATKRLPGENITIMFGLPI